MEGNIPDEYEIDPGTDIDRLAEIFVEQYPDAIRHSIDEVLFANEGPVQYLTWVAFDGYERHEFFYNDTSPDEKTLRRLLTWTPAEDEMDMLKAFLVTKFDVVKPIQYAALLEIPDTYSPGSEPGANLLFYEDPTQGTINVGINATPASHEKEIVEHVDKLVPASDLETFAKNIIRSFYTEIEDTAERHLVEGNIRGFLEANPDFRQQTTKSLPRGIYPPHTGEPAELWQKPVSKEPAIEGSQGFIQIWVPEEDDKTGFVTLTSGDYHPQQAVDAVRSELESEI